MKDAKLLVAISGGIDSVVLARLCHLSGLDMALAHCNFHLRGEESDKDEKFVRELSKQLEVSVYTEHFNTKAYAGEHGLSIQLAARELRYNWFAQLQDTLNFDYLLTAHHADDNLETFLINLSRGTGIEGLSGIPPVNGKVIRPLLPFSREEIFSYLKKNGWQWREDSSNVDTRYLRNKIRHDIVPQLKMLSPDFLEQFRRTQHHLSECETILKKHVEEIKEKIIKKEGERWIVDISLLGRLSPLESYLYYLFKDFSFPVDEVRKLLHAMSGKRITSRGYIMVKDRENLLIEPLKGSKTGCYTVDEDVKEITEPLHLKFFEGKELGENQKNTVLIDKDKLKYPLIVRKWEKGDYFYPLGMSNRKKLSKFFKDEKISVLDKQKIWLLCSGDDIVWVIGHRLDNRYKITLDTVNKMSVVLNPSE
ncbi:tRNA lysidine(34) synthetase TilS [Sinomicrobium weinanense]|uniref:tRNA lysidine(34) synthetase TilS n=1 Tax=Sinomicrobium weinanense TaxID=2842200 RepID=UPI001FFCA3AB|nr:tRNA lysidine(34) synthetase TilS [Sinomicrobium weinanense]